MTREQLLRRLIAIAVVGAFATGVLVGALLTPTIVRETVIYEDGVEHAERSRRLLLESLFR